MSRQRAVKNIDQRVEMYNLFLKVAHKIREKNRVK